jgi:hypothetical protein
MNKQEGVPRIPLPTAKDSAAEKLAQFAAK